MQVRHDCISTDLHHYLPLSSLARITSRHHRHHHHIYSPQNTISTSIQESRGRLPERHKHPSMLAALTTKRYNTSTQMHKKNIKKNRYSGHRRRYPKHLAIRGQVPSDLTAVILVLALLLFFGGVFCESTSFVVEVS